MAKYMMKLAEVRKMSKLSLVMKLMRDSTQAQKNKMLRVVLKRMPKAMLVRLCVMVAKRNLPKLKLTTKKGDLRKTSTKAFMKKRKAKTKTRSTRKPRRLIKGTPEAKRYMAKIRKMRK
jgi:hypothetical protein